VDGTTFLAWFARLEDIIVGKLMAWKEGRSFKHETDIRDILVAIRLGVDAELTAMFDFEYTDAWAESLGEEVQQFWQLLKEITQADVNGQ
jgi:hypothetical protein